MGWRGLLAGALALVALQTAVANPQASGRLGGLAALAGDLSRRFLSPEVPGFPRRAADVPSSSTSAATPAAATPPATVDLLKPR